MADQYDMTAKALMTHRLFVDLRDQRASGIEVEQIARPRIFWHRFWNAMGRKYHRLLLVFRGDLIKFLDKDRTSGLQTFDNIAIVDNLVANINGRAVFLQRQNNNLDGPVYAGTKSARPT
tara:strand:- start:194980 stop:195339 length:360 start_codon:yes stop_codon:yes gene_type:complete